MGNLSSVLSTKQSKFKPTSMTCGEKGYAQIQMRLSSSETIPAKSVSLCSQKCKIQGIRWHVNEILRLQRRNESTWGRWWLTVSIPSITSGKGVWDFFYFLFKDCLMQNCTDESKYHHHKNRASSHSAKSDACSSTEEKILGAGFWFGRRAWQWLPLGPGSRVEVQIMPFHNSELSIRSGLTLRVAERTAGPPFLWGGAQS